MKNFTRILITTSMLGMSIAGYSQDVFKAANVGIGKTNPSQKLDVLGNVQFSGALMPGGLTGSTGNILISGGAGAPTWLANGATGLILQSNGASAPTWVSASSAANAWNLTGNAGTTYGTNYIGTTDNSLMIKVGGQVAGRIETNSNTSSTSLGYQALNSNTATGSSALGYQALYSLTSGTQNVALGYQALYTNQTGIQNTAIGYAALKSSNNSGFENVAVGAQALTTNTSGLWNTALGTAALTANTTGEENTAVGGPSLYGNTTGSWNCALGTNALNTNTTGNYNIAIGYLADMSANDLSNAIAIGANAKATASNQIVLGSNGTAGAAITQVDFSGALAPYYSSAYNPGTLGQVLTSSGAGLAPTWTTISGGGTGGWTLTGNTGTTYGTNFIGTSDVSLMFKVGSQVAGRIETGSNTSSTSIGYEALNSNTGSSNSALGYQALYSNQTGIDNVALGYQSLYSNNTNGWYNVAIGYQDMMVNTSGQWNVGIGAQTLLVNTTGQKNTAVGATAMYKNTTGNFDVAVGTNALNANVSGSNNTAVGYLALTANTANNNSAFGNQALDANTTGVDNTALGYNAIATGNANDNTAVGYLSMGNASVSGGQNTSVGSQALYSLTTSVGNVGIGYQALYSNSTATGNVAVGYQALFTGSTGTTNNTALGYQALYSINSTSGYGLNNTAVGYQAGYSTTTGYHNTSIGTKTLYNDNGASYNTAVGENALYNNLSGAPTLPAQGGGNVAVGYEALYNNNPTGIGGGSNSAVGVFALQTNTTGSYNSALGYQADVSSAALSNATVIGAYAIATTSNQIILGSNGSNGGTAVTEVGFNGALAPYYSGAYQTGTVGQVLTSTGTGAPTWATPAASGVTLFSAGNLLPLFTTSVATPTTTPALSFTLNNAEAETILGNNTAIGAVPTYFSPTLASALFANQGTTTTVLHGNTSGNPSWGAVNLGTDVTGVLSPANGGTGLSAIGVNGQVLAVVSGAPTWANVNSFLSGTNGGILYGTGTGSGFTGAGVAGQILESTGAGEPMWVNVSTLDTIVGDNWGDEYVITDSISTAGNETTITGTGLGTNPLKLARQGATNGQVLTWNSSANTWQPGGGSGWQLTGNSGTTAGTDFVGTTDANDLVFKTNKTEVMRVANTNDNVGIGTQTPNASAALDVTSSTQGILIPRMSANPASPAQALMYYNTTTGCFMFYSGSTWQAIACGCPNTPPAPGSITGPTTFCSGATAGYKISPVGVATGYTWTVPTGATITAGQGSDSITVTFGSASGNISVAATNNCGTGAATTLAVTDNTPSITGQPTNPPQICGTGTATFTVTGTGGEYQWQVNTGSGYTNVTNGGVYSGATTNSLTVTNPPATMNGYLYQCVISGTCGPTITSTAATLNVRSGQSIPITITNSQSTATSAGLQVQLSIDFANYSSDGLNANLNNVEFSTGGGGSGTPLYAWIESPTAPTASATEFTTVPSSSNATAAVVWVNLGSSTIPANGTLTIYMSFQPSAVMTGTTGYTGEAPQLTSTYGQYDNGAYVFGALAHTPGFYDNFTGTSLSSNWTVVDNTIAVNNGLTITYVSGQNWTGIYTNSFTGGLNTIIDAYCKPSAVSSQGIDMMVNGTGTNGGGGYSFQMQADLTYGNGGCTVAPTTNYNTTTTPAIANDWYLFSAVLTNSPAADMLLNYTAATAAATAGKMATSTPVGLGVGPAGGQAGTFQWFRDRVLPPNAVAPTATFGTYGCY